MKGNNNMYSIEKEIIKDIKDRFYEDCIEELENEDYENYCEIIDEMLYEEGFRNEDFNCELKDKMEKEFENLREEYLEGKKDDWENECELREDYYNNLGV